jgi:hypothetical protein
MRHHDLPKTGLRRLSQRWGERCDLTVENGSVINPNELGIQRRDVRYGEQLPIPKDFRGQVDSLAALHGIE